MKILVVLPYLPTPVRVRSHYLVRELATYHDVSVMALGTANTVTGLDVLSNRGVHIYSVPHPRIRSIWNVARHARGTLPLQVAYAISPVLGAAVKQRAETKDFDVVHVEHLRGAHLMADVNLPVVWDAVDCISQLLERTRSAGTSLRGRALSRLDLVRTRAYEAQLLQRFPYVAVTSPQDRDALLRLADSRADALQTEVRVIPNGVNLAPLTPDLCPDPAESSVVFSGKMSYHANITSALYLCREVMPWVWERHPDTRVVIAGNDPPRAVRALGHDPRVTVTGGVPDIRPYLSRATVAVAPMLYGVGIQNKVLEAMAARTPVVASSQACAALSVTPGHDLLCADGPREQSEAILRLLTNATLRQQLGVAGRTYVEQYHQWRTAASRFVELYESAVHSHHTHRRIARSLVTQKVG